MTFSPRRVINLTFHGIGTPDRKLDTGEEDYWISRERFLAIIDRVPRDGSFCLTFDDGNASDLTIAAPALAERGLTAAFFVVAERIGQPGFLSAENIGTLLGMGMAIGSHGMRHRPWRGMDQPTTRAEIVEARQRLERCAGQPVTAAACPFGAYDRSSLRALRDAGFSTVFTSDRGAARQGTWLQPRNTIRGTDTPDVVGQLEAHSAWSPEHLARRARQFARRSLPVLDPIPPLGASRPTDDAGTPDRPKAATPVAGKSTSRLEPVDEARIGMAIDVLYRGPWKQPRAYWEKGLERMVALGANRQAGVPLGQCLMVDGQPAGILLTLASARTRADGSQVTLVNLAGWFVEPEQRWRSPLMLRAAMRQNGAVITDLSPSAAVQPMLPALGFKPLNRGEAVIPLPLAALRPASGRVCPLGAGPQGWRAEIVPELLAHESIGCIGAALVEGGNWHPLLFKRRTMKGLPVARLAYCDDLAVVHRNLAAVARYLLARGCGLLQLDIPLDGTFPGVPRWGHGMKFATDATYAKGTDYVGSELCLFDI